MYLSIGFVVGSMMIVPSMSMVPADFMVSFVKVSIVSIVPVGRFVLIRLGKYLNYGKVFGVFSPEQLGQSLLLTTVQ